MMDISVRADYLRYVIILPYFGSSDKFDITFVLGDEGCNITLEGIPKKDLLKIKEAIDKGLEIFEGIR